MPDIRECFVSALGYFRERQAFEEKHFDGPPLRFWQNGENLAREPRGLRHIQPLRRPQASLLLDFAQLRVLVKLSNKQIVSPVHAPAISKLQEPHLECPSRGIELSHATVNFKEYGLR